MNIFQTGIDFFVFGGTIYNKQMRKPKVSIVEIAKKANVSISTVSRYFNAPEKVSPKAAARIKAAVEKYDYQPAVVRPGPKVANRVGIRTGAISFLALGNVSPEEMLRKPALPILIGSIQNALLERRLTMQLAHVTDGKRLPEVIDPRNSDGVILFGKPSSPEILKRLVDLRAKLPMIWCFREHEDDNRLFDHIFYDNMAVSTIAVDYLLSHGHKKAAVFTSDPEHEAFQERVARFVKYSQEAGLEPVVFSASAENKDAAVFRELAGAFRKNHRGITGAFFCADDIMLGVYNELRAAGYEIDKLDMIGCNNDEVLLRYLSPRPATIDIKIAQVGEMAVNQLLNRINGENSEYSTEIFIKPDLIEGNK